MGLYVTRCNLDVNGQNISDFKSFTEKSRVVHKQVPLMYATGHAALTQRFQFDLDYVVPQGGDIIAWDEVKAGTVVIEYDDGITQVSFGGVYVLESGDAAIDGENELIRKISFGAETRNLKTGA